MTYKSIASLLKEKEEFQKREGVRAMIMDLRFLLDKLNIIRLQDSSFPSHHYLDRQSPLFKKKV